MRILKQSHSAKNLEGDPLKTKKMSKKSRTVPKKMKGGPLVSSGFEGNV